MVIRSIAITGATGFIGRHVAADLIARGVDRQGHRAPAVVPCGAARHDRGECSPRGAEAAAAFSGVDAVVHLAGVVAALNARSITP